MYWLWVGSLSPQEGRGHLPSSCSAHQPDSTQSRSSQSSSCGSRLEQTIKDHVVIDSISNDSVWLSVCQIVIEFTRCLTNWTRPFNLSGKCVIGIRPILLATYKNTSKTIFSSSSLVFISEHSWKLPAWADLTRQEPNSRKLVSGCSTRACFTLGWVAVDFSAQCFHKDYRILLPSSLFILFFYFWEKLSCNFSELPL